LTSAPNEEGDGLVRDWTFQPLAASAYHGRQRIKNFVTRLRRAPPIRILRRADRAPAWILYFVFLPDGQLTPAHRFTIARLKAMDPKLMIVCAAPDPDVVPPELHERADALIWKGMSGFDFSGYAAGLRHLAARSAGADVLVFNDSVLGPFVDLTGFLARARWALTGFTASQFNGNHIQSYGFIIRDLTRRRLAALRSVFVPGLAFDDFDAVVLNQETRFAAVAARRMDVGAFWYAGDARNEDPTLFTPEILLDEGFPFIKKSALGKFRHVIGNAVAERLDARLAAFGHPPFP